MLCVPDDAIANVAAAIPPRDDRVIAHVAGSRTLDVLAPHPRVGSLHPLMALPSGSEAERLIGATYCVAGDDLVRDVAAVAGGPRHLLARRPAHGVPRGRRRGVESPRRA